MTDLAAQKNLNIAVVGSGISGICTAYLLQKKHQVTLFEKENYFGGHTHTVILRDGPDKGIPVDTGFIVLNQRTYPNLIEFLSQLGVETRGTDMSFSYFDEQTGLCYASQGLNTLFAQRSNVFKPRYLRFVYEMVRYLHLLRKEYLEGSLAEVTLAEYVRAKGLHREVVTQFIVPMAAAIWSGSDFQMGKFPIRTFAQFYENHGLLGISGHPPWFFVKGGSHSYVTAFLAGFSGEAISNCPVTRIARQTGGATLYFQDRESQKFDAVVLATHADQSLGLLEHPSPEEKRLLGAWAYSRNQTILHTDASIMPPSRRAWASWNYTRHAGTDQTAPVTVTYDMTRLQKLETSRPYFVTLNPARPIPKEHIVRELVYTHPQFSFEAFASQPELKSLNGKQHTFFCGAYFGYGFHEDGVNSALDVAGAFGVSL